MFAKWRQVAALRILFHAGHGEILALLEKALESGDRDLTGAAVTILAQMADPRAARLLVQALERALYPPSRVGTHLDCYPIDIAGLLRPLLESPDPVTRFWAVTLLARYSHVPSVDADVARLSADPDPRVRKAVVETLGTLRGCVAVEVALRLVADEHWMVRAHAVRALGELKRSDLADRVAPLLADRQWWVRLAAKETLEAMGPEAAPVVVGYLDHPDRFARNGAAEVLQNLGVLDRALAAIAEGDGDPAKKGLLQKAFSAGGAQLLELAVVRGDEGARSRAREIVVELGLQSIERA